MRASAENQELRVAEHTAEKPSDQDELLVVQAPKPLTEDIVTQIINDVVVQCNGDAQIERQAIIVCIRWIKSRYRFEFSFKAYSEYCKLATRERVAVSVHHVNSNRTYRS